MSSEKKSLLDKLLDGAGITDKSPANRATPEARKNRTMEEIAADVVLDAFDLQLVGSASYGASSVIPADITNVETVVSPLSLMQGIEKMRSFIDYQISPASATFDSSSLATSHGNLAEVLMTMPVDSIGAFIVASVNDKMRGGAMIAINNGGYNTVLNIQGDKALIVIPSVSTGKMLTAKQYIPVAEDTAAVRNSISFTKTPSTRQNAFVLFEPIEGIANPEDDYVHPSAAWSLRGTNVQIQLTPIFPVGKIGSFIQEVVVADKADELAGYLLDAYRHQ